MLRSLLLCSTLVGTSLLAQTFEIVSVKPHVLARVGERVQPVCKGNRFVAVSPLDFVIRWAYDLDAREFKEFSPKLPGWAGSPSGAYYLEAKADTAVSDTQCRKMVQHLLIDRFKFSAHWETQIGDVYNLVVSTRGHKMPVVADGDQSRGFYETRNGRLLTPFTPGTLGPPGLTMDRLSSVLSARVTPQIPIINKTGLESLYKIRLAYSVGLGPDADLSAADLFTALEQQLGLKLEKAKGPVNHFIFERVEKPDGN